MDFWARSVEPFQWYDDSDTEMCEDPSAGSASTQTQQVLSEFGHFRCLADASFVEAVLDVGDFFCCSSPSCSWTVSASTRDCNKSHAQVLVQSSTANDTTHINSFDPRQFTLHSSLLSKRWVAFRAQEIVSERSWICRRWKLAVQALICPGLVCHCHVLSCADTNLCQ